MLGRTYPLGTSYGVGKAARWLLSLSPTGHRTSLQNGYEQGDNEAHMRLSDYIQRIRALGDLKVQPHVIDAIGFGMADYADQLRAQPNRVHLAYTLEENTWHGKTSTQLRIKDIVVGDI